MSKYMFIMRSSDEAGEAAREIPDDEIYARMSRYNQQLMDAGVLIASEGLAPAAEGFVVDFTSPVPVVTDGPYGETHELFDGFWIVDVKDATEALEWAKRIPVCVKVEVRRVPSVVEISTTEITKAELYWRERTGNL